MTTPSDAQVEAALKAYGERASYVGDAAAMRAALTAAEDANMKHGPFHHVTQEEKDTCPDCPPAPAPLGRADEDVQTIARRLKGCAVRREVPTWGEIEFAADVLLAPAAPAQSGEGEDEGWRLQCAIAGEKLYLKALAHAVGHRETSVDVGGEPMMLAVAHANRVADMETKIAALTQALATERAQSDRFEKMQDEANAESDLSEAPAIKAEAAIAEAGKVMEPFAKEGERPDYVGAADSAVASHQVLRVQIEVGHLRAASAWLERNRTGERK